MIRLDLNGNPLGTVGWSLQFEPCQEECAMKQKRDIWLLAGQRAIHVATNSED